MITSYEIRNLKKEKVVILHLDFSLEIGSFNLKKKEKFLLAIKKYINNLNLKENYQKILLMSGSIVVATLLWVNNDIQWLNGISNGSFSSDVVNTQIPSCFEEELFDRVDIEENKKESVENTDDSILNNNDIDEKKETDDTNKGGINDSLKVSSLSSTINKIEEKLENNEKQEAVKNEYKNKEEVTLEQSEQLEITEEKSMFPSQLEEVEKQKQMVIVYRSNGTVLQIELEDYIVGVVAAEMPASFTTEALKAQAVVARTYALRRISKGENLTDTVSTQTYIDLDQMKNKWGNDFSRYYSKIKNVVEATEGEYISYEGNYINAVYHSTSNGYTEDAENVWNEKFPYLKRVESNWDKQVSSYERTIIKDYQNLLEITGTETSEQVEIKIVSRNASGRVEMVQVGEKNYTGVEFRNLLGLRSTDFDIEIVDNNIQIRTRGYGHGVGMSQYGANEMAKVGYNYREIINHYYTGVQIQK